MNGLFSKEIMEEFKLKRPAGYVDLMIAFEARKRTASPYKNNALNISLPFSFIDFYKKKKVSVPSTRSSLTDVIRIQSSTVESAIRRLNDPNIKWSSQGMMRLTPEAMRQLFHWTVEKIKTAIGDVLNSPDVKGNWSSSWDLDTIVAVGIQYLFLVGGFAESPILAIWNSSSILVDSQSDHSSRCVTNDFKRFASEWRTTSMLTLGLFQVRCSLVSIQLLSMFVVLVWPTGSPCSIVSFRIIIHRRRKSSKTISNGVRISSISSSWSINRLAWEIQWFANTHLHDRIKRKCIISFYCSESDKAIYVTETGVRKIGKNLFFQFQGRFKPLSVLGTLVLDMFSEGYSFLSGKDRRREIQTRMVFGDTEIKVSALGRDHGQMCSSDDRFSQQMIEDSS